LPYKVEVHGQLSVAKIFNKIPQQIFQIVVRIVGFDPLQRIWGPSKEEHELGSHLPALMGH